MTAGGVASYSALKLLHVQSGPRPGRACWRVGCAGSEPSSRRAAGQRALLQARAPSAGAPGAPARSPGADAGAQSASITNALDARAGAVIAGPKLFLTGVSRYAP